MIALTALSRFQAQPGVDLRSELKLRLGQAPRRLSPFIQMALIGALDALQAVDPAQWRLALGTERGAIDELRELMAMHVRGEMPMPLTFINSQIHIVGHYLAQLSGQIESVEVGDSDQNGEELLLWHSQFSSNPRTLWGWVDLACPWQQARSDWLCLERHPATPPLGWLRCEWHPDPPAIAPRQQTLPQWLEHCLRDSGTTRFSCAMTTQHGGSWIIHFDRHMCMKKDIGQ